MNRRSSICASPAEKHYAPWAHARQAQLEAGVRRAWGEDAILFAEMKGTTQVRAKQERLN